MERTYIAIDLKSFYASVECVERGLNPMTTNLVVADESRTSKTICLAVTPPLKAYGLSGRSRLFEVISKVEEINKSRLLKSPIHSFIGESYDSTELKYSPKLSLSYIIAPPRMAYYIEYSTKIYDIYLKYVAPEDIHVYSIDEVFMDVTHYLKTYNMTARELAMKIILDVLDTTGITATAGIGTNLYLCKIAMDIVAKHIPADVNGVRIAELDEMSYRRELWTHEPITDFWRVGRGYAKKLAEYGMFTMGDVARCSVSHNEHFNEDLLYKLFGVNAELLIDHAWGYEPCTIAEIKSYKPQSSSLGSGQVLHTPYDAESAKLITREMTELLVLDLVEKRLVCNQIVLTVGYDRENLSDYKISSKYHGEVTTDAYGRKIPKHAHGSAKLDEYTSSAKIIVDEMMKLYDRVVNRDLLIRRINITANNTIDCGKAKSMTQYEQLDFFTDYDKKNEKTAQQKAEDEREERTQSAVLEIKKRYGKNAILKGMNLKKGATAIDRNRQIGGHKA